MKMNTNLKTMVRRAQDNGHEYGYKPEYIMIDVIVNPGEINEYILYGEAEAADDNDISNARRRAIHSVKKQLEIF
jgi:hypothetical protein